MMLLFIILNVNRNFSTFICVEIVRLYSFFFLGAITTSVSHMKLDKRVLTVHIIAEINFVVSKYTVDVNRTRVFTLHYK